MKTNKKKQAAFTVIELMIVIGMIGIMAALFIPTFLALTAGDGTDSRAPGPMPPMPTSPTPY